MTPTKRALELQGPGPGSQSSELTIHWPLADTIAAVGNDGTLRVISLVNGEELLRYDADNALADLAASDDGGLWAVDVSGRMIRLDPPR